MKILVIAFFLFIPFVGIAQNTSTQEQRIVRDTEKRTKSGKKKKKLSMKQKVKIDQKQDKRARKKKKPN
jgi:UPF0716 family protein affecting phage T7 exclusion